jgi:hypothetical protein
MTHFATRAGRWGQRQDERNAREAKRRVLIQSNPRQIVENIQSRQSIALRVASYMLHLGRIGAEGSLRDKAVDHVSDLVGVPREIVLECLSIEALETGA